MPAPIFGIRQTAFVLWRPANAAGAPKLVIGEFSTGNPPSMANRQEHDLAELADK